MGMNDTPSSERMHIAFFGLRNAGKSSLVNAVTGQNMAIVSDVRGTTTDPVYKSMELLPMGPVVIIDTPGIDDEGELGEMRVRKTKEVLTRTDVAVLVTDGSRERQPEEEALLALFREKKIPYVIAENKKDLVKTDFLPAEERVVRTSAVTGEGIRELKERIAHIGQKEGPKEKPIAADLVQPLDLVVLVIPIDASAPKGRLILPQQQVIRDLLEAGAVPVCVKETELAGLLAKPGFQPALVITDSQAFQVVSERYSADFLFHPDGPVQGLPGNCGARCVCHRRGEAGGHHPDFRGMYPPSPVRGHRNGETAEAPSEAFGFRREYRNILRSGISGELVGLSPGDSLRRLHAERKRDAEPDEPCGFRRTSFYQLRHRHRIHAGHPKTEHCHASGHRGRGII